MSQPQIVNLQWGRITVEMNETIDHYQRSYKDCRIWPLGSDEWDWKKTGTQHIPGIQFADFEDLLQLCPTTEVIIFSQGMHDQLHVHPETLNKLHLLYPWIQIFQLNTREAVDLYNKMRSTRKIIGLFHSTC